MLYLRTRDDAELTHATDSLTSPQPLCEHATGRTRLDYATVQDFDPASSVATTRRSPVEVHRATEVTCPLCAAMLAPQKIRSLALDIENSAVFSEPQPGASSSPSPSLDIPQPQPRRRLRRTT